jgi:CheY-like chemotaxis protein
MNHPRRLEQSGRAEYDNSARIILFVEDETFVREVTAEILQSVGYVVLSAKNAAEAEEILRGHDTNFDLLLTDVLLPGESGRLLAARFRLEHPGIKVLFVTGYAEQWSQLEDSGEECLAKPFSSAELIRRIGRLIAAPMQRERELVMPVGACA